MQKTHEIIALVARGDCEHGIAEANGSSPSVPSVGLTL
jgi:hypothetical protein